MPNYRRLQIPDEFKMANAVFGKGITGSTGYATNMLKQEFIPQIGVGITT